MSELIVRRTAKILEAREGEWFQPFTPLEDLGFCDWEYNPSERLFSEYYGYDRELHLETVVGTTVRYELGLSRDEVDLQENLNSFFYDDGNSTHFIPYGSQSPAQIEFRNEAILLQFGITYTEPAFGEGLLEKCLRLPSGMVLTERSYTVLDILEDENDERILNHWQHPITGLEAIRIFVVDSPSQFSKIALRLRRVDAK